MKRAFRLPSPDNSRGKIKYAGVVELVDSMDLGSITFVVCGFESRRPHHVGASYVSLAPTYFISQSALTPLLLLSKSNPLGWASILLAVFGGLFSRSKNIDFSLLVQNKRTRHSRVLLFWTSTAKLSPFRFDLLAAKVNSA